MVQTDTDVSPSSISEGVIVEDSSVATEVVGRDAEAQLLLDAGQTLLPKAQFTVLCLLRVQDPLHFTQIFPYINELVWKLEITNDPKQIGYYSGLVECVFAIAQLLAMYPWGVLSGVCIVIVLCSALTFRRYFALKDTVGRRPVILTGAAGLTIATLAFGFAQDFNMVLIARFFAGLFSGNVAVIPSVLSEITNTSNQAFAYPLFGIFWPIGAILGPIIGGSLSNPADKIPIFYDYALFREYPYLLPCCVIGGISAISWVLSYYFLEETLGSHQNDPSHSKPPRVYGAISNSSSSSSTIASVKQKYTALDLLRIPIIRALCASAYVLSFISTGFEVIFVLFCYSPIENGGIGFSPQEIGYALAIAGAAAAMLQVVVMPKALTHFSHAKLYHFAMSLWPIPFFVLPLLNILARSGVDPSTGQLSTGTKTQLWIAIGCLLALVRVAFIGFSINMLLVKRFSPSPCALGAIYGLLQFCICLSRALSPVFSSSLYVICNNYDILRGNMWAFLFILLSGIGYVLSRRVVYYAT